MFEYWRKTTYFADDTAVFPDHDFMDSLEIHDTYPRNRIASAINELATDFNTYLIQRGIYDYFYSMQYERVKFNRHILLFY